MRVGRAAIDEQGMRLLEQHNPDVDFDWARLLKDAPQDQSPRRERDRDRDPRERERRDRRDARSAPRPRPLETTAAAVPPVPPSAVHEANAALADERAAAHADVVLRQPAEPVDADDADEADGAEQPTQGESLAVTHGEPLAADHLEYVEYAEASGRLEPEAPVAPETPASRRLGQDGVARLRVRYTQLVVRLADKPMEDPARTELNGELERLNPDAWQTADEVAAALEQYEAVFERVRSHIGPPARRKL